MGVGVGSMVHKRDVLGASTAMNTRDFATRAFLDNTGRPRQCWVPRRSGLINALPGIRRAIWLCFAHWMVEAHLVSKTHGCPQPTYLMRRSAVPNSGMLRIACGLLDEVVWLLALECNRESVGRAPELLLFLNRAWFRTWLSNHA